jgi:RND superfamily putative drug exporter
MTPMEPVTPPTLPPARPPWTVRVAAWSARHRWPVAALWFVATIGLFVGSLLAGGTRSSEAVSNNERSKYEAGEAYVVWAQANANAGEQAPASQQFLLLLSSADRTLDDPAFQAAIGDITKRISALQAPVAGTTGPVFEGLLDPRTAPPEAGLVSADRSTVRIVARVPGDGPVIEERLAPVPAMVAEIKSAHPDFRIHVLNNTLTNDEIQELINGGLDRSLLLTIPITFVILLIAFGAFVAALIPLVLAVTALLAAFGILGLYSQVIAPVSPYASQLIVLIGLAVAVDYSLFMVTRFRTERRRGKAKMAAIEASSATAGRAVFFSGLAVMISIGGLFLLDDPLFRSMAIGTISVVFVAVVGSLTFLPATLAILGDKVNALRLPILGRERPEGSGVWAVVVRAVMRRPVVAAVATALALIALATPVIRLHMGQADFTSFPDSLDGVQAVNLLNEKWPSGTDLDLSVVVTGAGDPATTAAMDRMTDALLAIPGLSGPPTTIPSADGSAAFVSVLMSGSSNDIRNQDIVRQVRTSVVPATFGGLSGVRALVTGDAAYTLDVVDFYAHGMPLVMAFVLALSFVLLLVAFRSIVIPIKAILLNLLSTGAAFGLMVLVFQQGFLADVLGFKPGPIEGFIPVFIFTILFGLSMDYHVFILTRIKEARDHGLPSNEAVARGIAITSGTITSAAAIMVCVFAVFVTLPLVIIKQLGFGLAIAVLIDATVVRSILLPATMRLLGEWNWWLPRWLGWLPHVTIEGEVDEAPAQA